MPRPQIWKVISEDPRLEAIWLLKVMFREWPGVTFFILTVSVFLVPPLGDFRIDVGASIVLAYRPLRSGSLEPDK